MRYLLSILLFISGYSLSYSKTIMQIELSGNAEGLIQIELLENIAPDHVHQIIKLVNKKKYDGVAFHRVIEGFMAQTGDVQFGNVLTGYSSGMVGRGGSDLDNIEAEFSNIPFDRGIVGMARAQDPNSANSQFFIMFQDGHFLNENYTVFGKVLSGMDIVDKIKSKGINLVINTPMGAKSRFEEEEIGKSCIKYGVVVTTTLSAANAVVRAIRVSEKDKKVQSIQNYHV